MELRAEPVRLRFSAPVHTAGGDFAERELVGVTLAAGDGITGIGEAAPLEPYDGVSIAAVTEALEGCREVLGEFEADAPRDEALKACRTLKPPPQALAAVDLALWDREGKRAGVPVAALLSGEPACDVPVNATLGAGAPASAAVALAEGGFACLKLKVGLGGERAHVGAIRSALGGDVALRLDANGAWSEQEAVALLADLAPLGLELCEEPVHGVEALRRVRAALGGAVPLAMDETTAERAAIESGATELVCLKIAASGGITGLLADAAAAWAVGTEPYVASTWDGPAGIAAGLHAAAALGITRPCGLATLGAFDIPDPFPPRNGRIAVPGGPGLGLG